jgi:HD-GYP domain-containing protein (c-di-GMP phosphodiesterase class II)
MTTQRPYNKPLSFMEALKKCASAAGKHFDPKVMDALARFINKTMSSSAEARVGSQGKRLQEARLDG